jgi:hypothetical protein
LVERRKKTVEGTQVRGAEGKKHMKARRLYLVGG